MFQTVLTFFPLLFCTSVKDFAQPGSTCSESSVQVPAWLSSSVVCRLAEKAYCPAIGVNNEDIKQCEHQCQPLTGAVVSGCQLDFAPLITTFCSAVFPGTELRLTSL